MARYLLIWGAILIILAINISMGQANLSGDFYKETCPRVEEFVHHAVTKATMNDPKVPAGLLRMHFHDCFIQGCDGSILLDSKGNNTAEKDAPPNVSLHAFDVIDNAKASIESACPGLVSCADILAIAARDAVVLSGGPSWTVLKGRKDGRVSNASETRGLPSPAFNVSQLTQSFALRNLSKLDMVTLSGGHTLGFSHCSSFNTRLFHFDQINEVDPSIDNSFARKLQTMCPEHNTNHSAGAFLDSTGTKFDNRYYVDIMQGKGVFSSDQALFSDPETHALVNFFANDQLAFFTNFATSMVHMGNVGIKTEENGEIREHCRFINP
eukprot:c25354_g1_i3 orf=372-1346(-)